MWSGTNVYLSKSFDLQIVISVFDMEHIMRNHFAANIITRLRSSPPPVLPKQSENRRGDDNVVK